MPPDAVPVKVDPDVVIASVIFWSPSGDFTVQSQLPSTSAMCFSPDAIRQAGPANN
jgi:hypothetical protein